MKNNEYVLSVSDLRKEYSSKTAVESVSFKVAPNEIVGLLGPNGAGKTTTINMILGVLQPTSGEIIIDGINLGKKRAAALDRTNFAAVYAPLPGNLTVRQNLKVFGMIYNVKNLSQKIDELVEEFELKELVDKKCGVLSSGEQTSVSLAKSMLNSPNLLLLDEPTASLDPSTAKSIRKRITSFSKRGNTGVLWTSHNMYEVEEVCDRVMFLSKGRILLEGNPKTLAAENGVPSLEELFIKIAREPLALEN